MNNTEDQEACVDEVGEALKQHTGASRSLKNIQNSLWKHLLEERGEAFEPSDEHGEAFEPCEASEDPKNAIDGFLQRIIVKS